MTLDELFEKYDSDISAKAHNPEWLANVIKNGLFRNISATEWNAIVDDIRKIASDNKSTYEFLEALIGILEPMSGTLNTLETNVDSLNTGLADKVNTLDTNPNYDLVYVKKKNGEDSSNVISDGYVANAIPRRTISGTLTSVDPTNGNDVVNLGYLRDNVHFKANSYTRSEVNRKVSDEISDYDKGVQTTYATKVALSSVEGIAKGANQAISFYSYEHLCNTLKEEKKEEEEELPAFCKGQNLYIANVGVPDLWVYQVYQSKEPYDYEGDDKFIADMLAENPIKGVLRIGFYDVAMLETQEVDLTNYVENDDFQQAIADLQGAIGSISSALDGILALQNEKINGGSTI